MVKPQEKAINLILVEATIPQDMADLRRHSGCRYTLQNTELQSACNELSMAFPRSMDGDRHASGCGAQSK